LRHHYLSFWQLTMKSKSFDLKHFSLDSRYTNLPEERIQRNYAWTPIRCRRFGQRSGAGA
jgi:hypothetical protein